MFVNQLYFALMNFGLILFLEYCFCLANEITYRTYKFTEFTDHVADIICYVVDSCSEFSRLLDRKISHQVLVLQSYAYVILCNCWHKQPAFYASTFLTRVIQVRCHFHCLYLIVSNFTGNEN